MKKIFPPMTNTISGGHIFCIFFYWLFGFVGIPFLIPLIGNGAWERYGAMAWVECGYYAINAFFMYVILKAYLGDCFFELRINAKDVFHTVNVACTLMAAWAVLCYIVLDPVWSMNAFPISEMGVAQTPGFMVSNSPVLGTVCLTLVVPFGVCGLFYAAGFAPVCRKIPWLAYVVVSLVIALPAAYDIFWRNQHEFVVVTYALRLPIHLIACWSYQKTDNIWTPIISLSIFNLLASVVSILL